jgi:peptidoglycan LD-endopeptidase LytH
LKRFLLLLIALFVIAGIVGGYYYLRFGGVDPRSRLVWQWLRDPQDHADWAAKAGERCGDAPFQMPTEGFIGYLWDDSFKPGHRHQGLDIFGGTEPGITPVYAAYDGYLTREIDWKSSLIIRIPSDPLNQGTQIWTYYTHLADAEGSSLIDAAFPPRTTEVFVAQGTLLGYQGNFSGTPGSPVGVHLHFSIVRDDGSGAYLNELEIGNTLDPSPYFGLGLSASAGDDTPVRCTQN